MSANTGREAFEKWYIENYRLEKMPQRVCDKPGTDYWSDGATCAWHGWQARALLAQTADNGAQQ